MNYLRDKFIIQEDRWELVLFIIEPPCVGIDTGLRTIGHTVRSAHSDGLLVIGKLGGLIGANALPL